MGDDIRMEISIPTDDDGYVLLKCTYCGEFFKATPFDIRDDGVLEIYCPSCGLSSDNYLTDDVIELAMVMVKNAAINIIYEEIKKINFKAGRKPDLEPENPICSGIEALTTANFPCCKRSIKIKPILKMTGCYCPFCGVKNFEVE